MVENELWPTKEFFLSSFKIHITNSFCNKHNNMTKTLTQVRRPHKLYNMLIIMTKCL